MKAGQLLALIDAPEVDQQLAQARADLQTARANQALAETTATRWSTLLAEGRGVEAGSRTRSRAISPPSRR